jgi:hypothetical protein
MTLLCTNLLQIVPNYQFAAPLTARVVNFPVGAFLHLKFILTFKTCTTSWEILPEPATNFLEHEVTLEKSYEYGNLSSRPKIITLVIIICTTTV